MGLGDMAQMMKLQKDMKDMQKRVQKMTVTGASADGLVKATVNGEFKLLSVEISDDLVAKNDRRAVEKSVLAAVNAAADAAKQYGADEMKKLTGGMNIPGLDSFLK